MYTINQGKQKRTTIITRKHILAMAFNLFWTFKFFSHLVKRMKRIFSEGITIYGINRTRNLEHENEEGENKKLHCICRGAI